MSSSASPTSLTSPTSPISSYSRDLAIAAIRSFYIFITNRLPRLDHDVDEDGIQVIREPPSTGWPELEADDALAPLGKSATVIDLLRHLPYLADDDAGSDLIGPDTRAIRYNGSDVRWCLDRGLVKGTLEPVGAGDVPAHVAVLTQGGRYGSWLLLDTEMGELS